VAGSAADRKRNAKRRPQPQAEVAVAPPRTLAPEAERRGGGRSRAAIGASRCEAGFHETFHGGDERLFGAWRIGRTGEGRGNRPAARAGREAAQGFGPETATRTGSSKRLRPRKRLRESGKAFGRRRDPQGISRGFTPREVPRKAGRLRPSVFRKGDLRGFGSDASLETVRLRPGRIRQKGSGGGISVPQPPPDGDRRAASSRSAETHRGPNGASRPRCGTRGKRPGLRPRRDPEAAPARDGLATQRRQSRLGQVGAGGDTGPHYLLRTVADRPHFSVGKASISTA
jgi:hypothetical protein